MLKVVSTVFFFCFAFVVFSQINYKIQGKIISSLEKERLSGIPVVLLKQNPNANPPLFPIARSITDAEGNYSFTGIEKEEGASYLIGALIEENRISSNAITLGKEPVQILNIEFFPEVKRKISFDTSLIEYTNRLLLFNALKDKVRIAEIIQIQNNSNEAVNSQNQPLKLPLPKNYEKFSAFQLKEEILNAEAKEDYALLFFEVPPQKSELYVEYELPFYKELTYTHPPFSKPNTPLSLIFDERYLSIVALGKFLNFDKHGKYTIASFSKTQQEPITFSIRSKILYQNQIWIFAYIFTAVAILSIIIFWYKNKKTTNGIINNTKKNC